MTSFVLPLENCLSIVSDEITWRTVYCIWADNDENAHSTTYAHSRIPLSNSSFVWTLINLDDLCIISMNIYISMLFDSKEFSLYIRVNDERHPRNIQSRDLKVWQNVDNIDIYNTCETNYDRSSTSDVIKFDIRIHVVNCWTINEIYHPIGEVPLLLLTSIEQLIFEHIPGFLFPDRDT